MRILLALLLTAPSANAGVIQGMVLEYGSGLPLSRSHVALDAVDASGVHRVKTLLSARGGQFTFSDLPPGSYLVSASRASYATAYHGQRRPEGYGQLIELAADSAPFIELRLHKLGVITGTVKDENGVGMPGLTVSAYSTRRPMRALLTVPTDDRGAYRLFGLAPGTYFVRSGAAQTADGATWTPTFAPETLDVREARRFEARVDLETAHADLRPMPGELGTVTGSVNCANPDPVEVTLSHDTGRRIAQLGCNGSFRFGGLVPGRHELTLSGGKGTLGWFEEVIVQEGRETRLASLTLLEIRPTLFESRPEGFRGKLLVRRRDPAMPGEPLEVSLGTAIRLAPGHWEITGLLGDHHWLSSVQSLYDRVRNTGDLDPDWYVAQVQARGNGRIIAQISDGAASIQGVVQHESNPAAAKPVFLLPVGQATRRAVNGPRRTFTDSRGRFRFAGLAPGDYRLLSSDDLTGPEDPLLLGPAAQAVTLDSGTLREITLPLYRTP